MNFQFDATSDGRPIKIGSVVDCTPVKASATWSTRAITAEVLIDQLDRPACGG